MGSVYQRGSRYWIKYRDERTGRLVRRSAGSTRLEAVLSLERAEEGRSKGRSGPRERRVPLASVLSVYLSHLESVAKRRSVGVARSSVGKLLESLADRDARRLSPADLDRFISSRKQEGVKSRTINGDLIVLRAAFHHALRSGLLDSVPVRVRLLKTASKRVLSILGPEEIRLLLKEAWEPFYGILLVAAHTGFRLSEILHLTWSDVLWNEGKVAVTAKDGWESKSYQERAVYLPGPVLEYLKARKQESRFKWIFSTRNGTSVRYENAGRALRLIWKRAGLYREGLPTTHWIRHSVCSRLLGEGVDVETVRVLMGHASAATTMLYAHSSDERLRSAARKLSLL